MQKIALSPDFPVIDIDKISKCLKGIKGHSKRKKPTMVRNAPIFNECKNTEIKKKYQKQNAPLPLLCCGLRLANGHSAERFGSSVPVSFFRIFGFLRRTEGLISHGPPFHPKSTPPAGQCGQNKKYQVLWPREHIKSNTCKQQTDPLSFACKYRVIQDEYNAQKQCKGNRSDTHLCCASALICSSSAKENAYFLPQKLQESSTGFWSLIIEVSSSSPRSASALDTRSLEQLQKN